MRVSFEDLRYFVSTCKKMSYSSRHMLKITKPNYLTISLHHPVRWPKFYFSKFTLNIVVLLSAAGELALRATNSDDGFKSLNGSEIFYPICIFATCLLGVIMLIGEKMCLIRSSANLSLFWPLLSFSLVPNFKIQIENLQGDY